MREFLKALSDVLNKKNVWTMWLPDQPCHDWEAKPPTVKGVSSKPGNEKTMSLAELNEKTNLNTRFLINERR